MDAQRFLPHYTYDDYVQWEGRWELIEGIPFAMSPAPRPKHQWVAAAIRSEFVQALKGCKACRVYDPVDYKISEETILQPDILIVCSKIEKKFLDFPPSLLVEVLSPSTASKDRMYKLNTYERQGVKYYLIVDADNEQIAVLELKGEHYNEETKGHDFTFRFSFPEGFEATIDFSEVWK